MNRLSFVLSVLAAVLMVVCVYLSVNLTTKRAELANSNLIVQQAKQLEPIYRQLLRTLAETSTRRNDPDLKKVLDDLGINVTVSNNSPKQ